MKLAPTLINRDAGSFVGRRVQYLCPSPKPWVLMRKLHQYALHACDAITTVWPTPIPNTGVRIQLVEEVRKLTK